MRHYAGSCHCGALTLDFASEKSPAELGARACQCSFCRKHGGISVSDPDGAVTIFAASENAVSRYRFGLGITDFLLCADCGVYVAATCKIEGRPFAVINANALDARAEIPVAEPISYDGEDVEARLARRATKWTPVTMQIGQG